MSTLEPGTEAPAFELTDQHGQTLRLHDLRGRKVLVYFYPQADTPGCTIQSCDLRDHRQHLAGVGTDVVGISPDRPEEQLAFDRKFDLGFPLLSDPDHATADAWGTWDDERGGIRRSSFLVDEEGRLEGVWYGVRPEHTVPNAVAALG